MQLNASFRDIVSNDPEEKSRLTVAAVLDGKLHFKGPVVIEGEVHGEIIADDLLVIAETAIVKATITAAKIIVRGKIDGDLTASEAVTLEATAAYTGNITAPSIMIEEGALFEGRSSMSEMLREADPARDQPVKSPVVDLQGKLDEFMA